MKTAALRLVTILYLALLGLSWPSPSHADDVEWVETETIFVQQHADRRCPVACAGRKWTGEWKTVYGPVKSLCACAGKAASQATTRPAQLSPSGFPTSSPGYNGPRFGTHEVYASSLLNEQFAKWNCPKACGASRWTGNWRQTRAAFSDGACECDNAVTGGVAATPAPPQASAAPWPSPGSTTGEKYKVKVGNVKDEAGARKACPRACKGGTWTGKWRKGTLPELQATCNCISN